MKRIGYACVRVAGESLEPQIHVLEALDCWPIFMDSGAVTPDSEDWELAIAIKTPKQGDRLVLISLDRLSTSVGGCAFILRTLHEKGTVVEIVEKNRRFDGDRLADLVIALEMADKVERVRQHEKQLEGIKRARTQGRYRGNAPFIEYTEVKRLRERGHSVTEIAEELKVSRQTIYNALKSSRIAKAEGKP